MPSMTMKRLCILLPSLLLPQMSLAQKQAQCYYPNGKVAAGDFPCDPDSEDSAFCGGALGSVCINNKLCRGPDGNLARGSCTSQTWQSPECASFCLGANTGGTDLISCSNITKTDTSYCCDHNSFCCEDGIGRFDVFPSNPQIWATFDTQASRFVVVQNRVSTSSSLTSSSTSTSLVQTSPAFVPTLSTSTTPNINTNPTQTTESNVEPSQTSSPSLSAGAQAGIGTGVAIVGLLATAVAYLLWRLRNNRKALNEPEVSRGGSSGYSSGDQVFSGGKQELMDTGLYEVYTKPAERQELESGYSRGYQSPVELPAHR